MKKFMIVTLMIILTLSITGCGKKNSSSKTTEIENCPDCVFATYKNYKKYGKDGDILTDYTTDYTTLKKSNGRQQDYFLGHILDENGKILRAFSCGIINDVPFCIEGTTDGIKAESNVKILKQVYGENDCTRTNSRVKCTSSTITSIVEEKGYVDIGTYDNKGYCYVASGYMNCF